MEITIWLRIKSKGLKRKKKKKKNPEPIRNNVSVCLRASCDIIAEKEFRGQDGV